MKTLFWILIILLGLALTALVSAIMSYARTLKWKRRLKTDDILRSKWEAFNKADQECKKLILDVQLLDEMINAFQAFLKVENLEELLRELEMAKTELNTARECSIDVFIKANLELDKYCEEFNIERME
jgi:LPS O-antigen subunit length determinant protein (WzzB/FepE family)